MRLPITPLLLARNTTTSSVAITGNVTDTALLLPSSQPGWAEKLDPQISGFSIEMDHWRDWAGNYTGQSNAFVNTALGHLSERTGQPVFFRVGANSEDRATLNLSVQVMDAVFPEATADVPAPEATSISIGNDFYALSGNLPKGTLFHWGVNLKVLNATETLAQVSHLEESFTRNTTKDVVLKYVEFGNEPDVFAGFASVAAGWEAWNVGNYTATWTAVAKSAAKGIAKAGAKLSPGSFVNFGPQFGSLSWTPSAAFMDGMLADNQVAKNTGQWTMHQYSGAFADGIAVTPGTLMDKTNIRTNISSKADGIRFTKSQGLAYVLSETNSYANHGIPGLSNTAEQTLWAIQQMLQGASMGIGRHHFHNGRGFKYNVLQPIALEGTGVDDGTGRQDRPHIMPLYYAFLVVNEAVGKTGNSYIVELPTNTLKLSAYGVFENKKLVRAVLVNTDVYTADSSARSGQSVTLSGGSSSATLRRFSTPYTNSTTGFTWAGQDFDTATSDPVGTVSDEAVNGGVITLEASSAVLVSFN